ncbi:MAG TPA: pantoate--beta-alanine ligase [Bdellovibrionales bacterium]|nr:pantoate--beta-alanine ligase [Bdellovibrionales bacterium]
MKIELIRDLQQWQKVRQSLKGEVGFVPTMGALHTGHASLLKRAREENDVVILSIYVNPTQFNDPKDLEKYPQTLEADLEVARQHGVDYVIAPTYAQIYPDGYRFKVTENQFSNELCGAHRPGHFDGVLTVVMKLFNLVRPMRAYFGEKDFQQLSLIRDMAKTFFMDIDVVPCPTLREADGLAMSSRNVHLAPSDRTKAPRFHDVLVSAKSTEEARDRLQREGFVVDYVEDRENRRLSAVKLGNVRLIDNVER